ncbi:hypothetical protein TIFTF001_020566 [Ficus carica]|uniref:Uncharacterized protein n=1 Tax=Ficus carica TaxID=3494 RepID=A0AA88AF60_FICCA|nr:hypothetical protein TIFTF001_020566 [Ficus carica]
MTGRRSPATEKIRVGRSKMRPDLTIGDIHLLSSTPPPIDRERSRHQTLATHTLAKSQAQPEFKSRGGNPNMDRDGEFHCKSNGMAAPHGGSCNGDSPKFD